MKAWELSDRQGSVDSLHMAERPDPVPAANEALVRIRASALNYRDRLIVNLIDRRFPFAEAPAAYRHLASGTHFGKVVITHD